MEILRALLKGIISGFTMLTPVSYTGHETLFRFTNVNLTKGGYDSILPLVIQIAVIISLVYFLRKDLLLIFKTSGLLLKDIKGKNIDIKTEDKPKRLVYMIIISSSILILAPLFELIFKGMSSNLMVVALAFITTAVFIIMSQNIKESTLKEENQTVFNSLSIGIFKLLSIIPGLSGIGGMYFAGLINGFTREFALKFTYIITLISVTASFVRNIIVMLISGATVIYSIWYYIVAFLGALLIGGVAVYIYNLAVRRKHTLYFAVYNIVIGALILMIWIRG